MSANILANSRNKKLTIVIVTFLFGLLLAPRDPVLLAGPNGTFILPTMFSGIAFGMAIILLVDLIRGGFGDSGKATNQDGE